MASVVDFLEKLGSEARWRHASRNDIEAALADAGIEASMCKAILAKNAAEVQALLGRVKMMPQQTPNPEPAEVPKPPQPLPGIPEEEEEEGGVPTGSKPSHSASVMTSTSARAPL
jgi:hypothetical protein